MKWKDEVHPRSRRAHQIQKKIIQKTKIETNKATKSKQIRFRVNRFKWFLDKIKPLDVQKLNEVEIHNLIEEFIKEKEAEFEKEKERKRGKVSTTMQLLEGRERKEYNEGGLELPDFTDVKTFKAFKEEWDGTNEDKAASFKVKRFANPTILENILKEAKGEAATGSSEKSSSKKAKKKNNEDVEMN